MTRPNDLDIEWISPTEAICHWVHPTTRVRYRFRSSITRSPLGMMAVIKNHERGIVAGSDRTQALTEAQLIRQIFFRDPEELAAIGERIVGSEVRWGNLSILPSQLQAAINSRRTDAPPSSTTPSVEEMLDAIRRSSTANDDKDRLYRSLRDLGAPEAHSRAVAFGTRIENRFLPQNIRALRRSEGTFLLNMAAGQNRISVLQVDGASSSLSALDRGPLPLTFPNLLTDIEPAPVRMPRSATLDIPSTNLWNPFRMYGHSLFEVMTMDRSRLDSLLSAAESASREAADNARSFEWLWDWRIFCSIRRAEMASRRQERSNSYCKECGYRTDASRAPRDHSPDCKHHHFPRWLISNSRGDFDEAGVVSAHGTEIIHDGVRVEPTVIHGFPASNSAPERSVCDCPFCQGNRQRRNEAPAGASGIVLPSTTTRPGEEYSRRELLGLAISSTRLDIAFPDLRTGRAWINGNEVRDLQLFTLTLGQKIRRAVSAFDQLRVAVTNLSNVVPVEISEPARIVSRRGLILRQPYGLGASGIDNWHDPPTEIHRESIRVDRVFRSLYGTASRSSGIEAAVRRAYRFQGGRR